MGYALAFGNCLCCNRIFSFNPMKVPSHRDAAGIKQPICKDCILRANEKRAAMNPPLAPHAIMPGAYEPCDEGEL